MLTNLLPGLREIRAPLISGYLWLALLFLVFHDELPSSDNPGSVLSPLFEVAHDLSAFGVATVTGVAAYLVGSAAQELWKVLGRLLSPRRPLYGESGVRTSAAGQRDVQDAVRIRVQAIRRKLFQVALAPGEKGIDAEPDVETVERELPLIRTLLLGERPELVGELDRLQAEADLRITVAFPLAFFAIFLAVEDSLGWLLLLIPCGLLLVQGYQRQLEAGDLLAKALRIEKADAPALAALRTSADAALERVELEGELRRRMDDGDGLAAFRLGNLQASWEDYEAATVSLGFAIEKGIVRAYAELGLVCESRGNHEDAERAYRDGDERGDRKAGTLLADLLNRLQREEEAIETAKRIGEAEGEPRPDDGAERAAASKREDVYRRRADMGDAKAAINLGLLLARKGDWSGAIDAFQRATEVDPEDARAWSHLGNARYQRRHLAEARLAYERALALQEADLGPNHLEVATALERLGGVLWHFGEYQRAQGLLERALRIQEEALGPDHLRLTSVLLSLGSALRGLGKYAEAKEVSERALTIVEREQGPSHSDVGYALGTLASVAADLGEYERARELGERRLEIAEASGDRDKLEVPVSLNNLGNTYADLGEYSRARELQERALSEKRDYLGSDNPTVAFSLDSLGNVLLKLGDLEGAEKAFERALEIFRSVPNRPATALVLRGLAETLLEAGRSTEALKLVEEAAGIQRQTIGSKHPELAETLDLSARILDSLNQEEPADAARTTATAIRREHGRS